MKSITWNETPYKSIKDAHEQEGIPYQSLLRYVALGYTCDDDIVTGKPCVWNGVEFQSITEAAEASGYNYRQFQNYRRRGFTCDADVIAMRGNNPNATPCKWNGIEYPSVTACAEANGISTQAMCNRLSKGYTCDDDLKIARSGS